MARIFRQILVTVEPEPGAVELLSCFDALDDINEEHGSRNGHAIFAQVFGCKDSPVQFFLTGCILSPEKALKIKAILEEGE